MITSDDLALLFVNERNRLLGLARKLCAGSTIEADDLISETFVRAWRRRETFTDGKPPLPWVSKIMANTSIDLFRRNRRFRRNVSMDRLGSTPEQYGIISLEDEDLLVAEERKAALNLAVEQLPTKLREVCQLIYFQGQKYHVAAATLGIKIGTVKSRMNTAAKRLAESLALQHECPVNRAA